MVKVINWGIDHFWGWVLGNLIAAIIVEMSKNPALKPMLEFYKWSSTAKDMAGTVADIYWWLTFIYSAISAFFYALRRYFNIWLQEG